MRRVLARDRLPRSMNTSFILDCMQRDHVAVIRLEINANTIMLSVQCDKILDTAHESSGVGVPGRLPLPGLGTSLADLTMLPRLTYPVASVPAPTVDVS
jgi:hypothetical protein